jgi:hypothetical protein
MRSALHFLVVARRCEIDELETLAHTCGLVGAIGRLVHGLQRERGLSNVLLASGGRRFAAQRQAQLGECLRLEQDVRDAFDELESQAHRGGSGTRLFSRIAAVVPGLDALPVLRQRVGALELDAAAATTAYGKLVAGLLAVVFEAADGATDPEISRLLAALFNFMQGKEFAGQERACGGAAFAAGGTDEARRQHWLKLIAAQDRCFRFFVDFAGPAAAERWQRSQPLAELAELERLRRIACTTAGTVLDADLATTWFDCCSLRIDAMKAFEESLTDTLQSCCVNKVAQARAEAVSHETLLARLPEAGQALANAYFEGLGEPDATALAAPGGPFGQRFERSVLDMLQEQSLRLQRISDELEAVRAALNERKLVERAKGLLMARRRIGEADAHRLLSQTAMNQGRRLVDVAESVLSVADYLADGA